jgi:geranylgeranyl diphosphate synthase type II
MSLKEYLEERRLLVNEYLKGYFSSKPFPPERLFQAITYSLFAGGKRIRPLLAITSFEACGGKAEDVIPQASALELIHTYSLIHDDLPSMDDDDFRRGKPTNHKVFGEALAILAGDALLTEAFIMFMQSSRFSPTALKEALLTVATAAGARGMVGGQAEDILSEGKDPDPRTVHFIHTHKTGALISASVRIGPLLAGSPPEIHDALSLYGDKIGLAFQIIDDILNVTGNEEDLGKKTGTDQERGKMTYPALYGLERSRAAAQELIDEAKLSLAVLGEKGRYLGEIADYLSARTS